MEVQWKINNDVIKAIYWSKNLSLKEVEQKGNSCEYLQIWYPQNLDDTIYERYGDVMTYIELNGKWKGKAYSSIIDLTQSKESIMSHFSETRRYETRRARDRDDLYIDFSKPVNRVDIEEFIDFYNRFAKSKGLSDISSEKTLALVEHGQLVIAKVYSNENETLSMHGYVVDKDSKRVSLYTSSSLFRNKREIANLIGRANGLLHYQSMLHFKDEGYHIYDFGGAYMGNDNIQLQNVTKYKMSFGGELAEYDNSVIIPFRIIREVDTFIENNMNTFIDKKIIIWGMAQYGRYLFYRMKQLDIMVSSIIDNKLADNNINYTNDSILAEYNANNTMVIVTTSIENFDKISRQENCRKFVETQSLISLKKEIQKAFV